MISDERCFHFSFPSCLSLRYSCRLSIWFSFSIKCSGPRLSLCPSIGISYSPYATADIAWLRPIWIGLFGPLTWVYCLCLRVYISLILLALSAFCYQIECYCICSLTLFRDLSSRRLWEDYSLALYNSSILFCLRRCLIMLSLASACRRYSCWTSCLVF